MVIHRIVCVLCLILVCLSTASPVLSQQVNSQITLSQPLGPEEDIQTCTLYVSNTGNANEYGKADEIKPINILDPNQVNPLQFVYQFYAPPNAETDKWFVTTFTDTSGNESKPSAAVKVRVDKLPPGAPVGLTASEVQVGSP